MLLFSLAFRLAGIGVGTVGAMWEVAPTMLKSWGQNYNVAPTIFLTIFVKMIQKYCGFFVSNHLYDLHVS